MKMTKKILVAALAVATFGLTSCIGSIGAEDSIIKGTLSNSHVDWAYHVEDVGDFGDFYRHISTTRTNRESVIVEINMNNANECQNSVMGVAFDITENDDGTLNFFCMGLHANCVNHGTKKPEYYVSFFGNIDPEKMGEQNFGANITETERQDVGTPAYEIMLSSTEDTGYVALTPVSDFYFDGKGNEGGDACSAIFAVTAKDDGSYLVEVYKKEVDEKGKTITDLEGRSPVFSLPISNTITKETETVNAKLGWYVMVAKEKTLKGTWKAYEISGEPIEE